MSEYYLKGLKIALLHRIEELCNVPEKQIIAMAEKLCIEPVKLVEAMVEDYKVHLNSLAGLEE